jgi:hypothetical protein
MMFDYNSVGIVPYCLANRLEIIGFVYPFYVYDCNRPLADKDGAV